VGCSRTPRSWRKDYWVLQGLFLFIMLAVIVFNLIADFTYAYLDPRAQEA
jgi:ABC-type dipeptide/oligopeptide/nickel transport system permease component